MMRWAGWVLTVGLIGAFQSPAATLAEEDGSPNGGSLPAIGGGVDQADRGATVPGCDRPTYFSFMGGGRDPNGTIDYPPYVDSNADRLQFRRELRKAEQRMRSTCK